MSSTPVRSSIERFFFAWFFVLIPAVYALRVALDTRTHEFSRMRFKIE